MYLAMQEIDDPNSYYDANKVLKLKDKQTPEVGVVLEKVIKKFKTLCQEVVPSEMIQSCNNMLLE